MSRQRWFETLHPSVVLVYLVGVMGLGLCTLQDVYKRQVQGCPYRP